MTARPGLRSYLAWSFRQFSLFIFEPSVYVEETKACTLPKERMRYLFEFLVLPCLIILLAAAIVAYFCTIFHVRYSVRTTIGNLAVGMGVGLALGFPVGMRYGIPHGLLFGMAVGVIVGYPFSNYVTLPLPPGHLFLIVKDNHVTSPIAAPMRHIWITCAMAILGGLYFRTILVVLGSTTRGVLFGMGLGCVHGIAVGLLLDPWTGLLSGTVVGVALAVGFTQRLNILGSVIFSAAFGAAFGIPLAEAFRFVKQPGYDPIWGLWVALASTGCFWLTYERYLLYPVQALQTIACYLSIRNDASDGGSNVLEMWRRCPIIRDETIRAPLPFVTEFLVRIGREDRGEGLNQIFFLMADRPSQRNVALDAFVQLIPLDLEIQTVDEIARVSSKITWMTDIPPGLIPNLPETLSVFDEVSQSMASYATTDPKYAEHRKALLVTAINSMVSLQKSLSVRGDLSVVNFLETANHWLEVLNTERALYSETEFATDSTGLYLRQRAAKQVQHVRRPPRDHPGDLRLGAAGSNLGKCRQRSDGLLSRPKTHGQIQSPRAASWRARPSPGSGHHRLPRCPRDRQCHDPLERRHAEDCKNAPGPVQGRPPRAHGRRRDGWQPLRGV